MKVFSIVTLLLGAAAALEVSDSQRVQNKQKRTFRPVKADGAMEVRTPSGAPAEYHVGTTVPVRERSMSGLAEVPAQLTTVPLRRRRESLHAARALPPSADAAQDFFECQNSSPAPVDSDCQVVADQVRSTGQTSVVQARACLTFNYQTCQGFFCALCETLAVTSDFIANQLDQVEFLCVADGKAGAIVGENAPQWSAGFVRAGNGLPSYNVC